MEETRNGPPAVATPAHSLRPAGPEDAGFLLGVYAATREEELAQVAWHEGEKEAFLLQQFTAQDAWYRNHYAGGSFDVIQVKGRDAGRLYLLRTEDEIRIVDIALLPAERRAGVGSRILQDLMAEARAAGQRLTIHVEKFNPAMRLYDRLGFRPVDDRGVYLFMEWRGDAAS